MRMRAAVLGSPIAHSLSPTLHNAAYLALGVEGKYDAVEVKANELAHFFDQVKETDTNWVGFSLTMPLKEEILKLADRIDPLARQIKSANTLVPTMDGWLATSTDVSGFIWALATHEVSDFKKVQIIGAGATARAAAAAIDAKDRSVQVFARNAAREADMRASVTLSNLVFSNWDEIGKVGLNADLVINTTPAGAADDLPSGNGVLFESLYHPWPTKLSAKWDGKVIDGLELLIHQAIDQIHLMTGFVIDRKLMHQVLRTAGEAELRDRS